ncbi:MAG: glycosyltransferase family 4 protein [Pseudomonadota bacterium]|nr:glycosyltransferase family 4 protein [Pseudomonadota bacterium]
MRLRNRDAITKDKSLGTRNMVDSLNHDPHGIAADGADGHDVRDVVFVAKFDLEYPSSGNVQQIQFELPPIRNLRFVVSILSNLWKVRNGTAIFVSIPGGAELLFLFMAKMLYRRRLSTFTFDLLLRAPETRLERLSARMKRLLLRAVDVFICVHKDVSGYARTYGIPPDRCEYVAFKPNNWDLESAVVSRDGDYVVALGASHRDYRILIEAVRDVGIPVKIILPRERITMHNADLGDSPLPANVEHLEEHGGRLGWNRYMAESRLVVIPILPGVIQPAGVSVYLEAMALGKPVVITRGASTEGILDERLAVLVPPGDAQALRAAIVEVWNDAALRRSLGAAARAYARSLGDHKRLVADIRDVIQRKLRAEAVRR